METARSRFSLRSIPAEETNQLVTGEFTVNGEQDVAFPTNNEVGVLLGNGNGTFGPFSAYSVGGSAGAVAVGDFAGKALTTWL